MKVIETNINRGDNTRPIDCQSRVIDIDDWEKYCQKYKNYNGEAFGNEYKSSMHGMSMPKNAIIDMLECDSHRIIVVMKLPDGLLHEHYAYLSNTI